MKDKQIRRGMWCMGIGGGILTCIGLSMNPLVTLVVWAVVLTAVGLVMVIEAVA
jgi:hypothetical protein